MLQYEQFPLYRPFEFLRNYVNYEKIPVKLLGSGRDYDYSHDGVTHWANDDEAVLSSLPNIDIHKPQDLESLGREFNEWINSTRPAYLNLRRAL